MSLKFFADHCVSNSVIQYLRDAGHEVLRLKDHMPTDSPDSVVISKAYKLDAILVSLNGDFADIRLSFGLSFGTLLDKLICRLNLERVLGRLSNQYFKARPIRPTTLPKYFFLGIKSFSYLFKYI